MILNWIRKFMMGRYGVDHLGRLLLVLGVICLLLNSITRFWLFWLVALVLLVISYLRIFSKNTSARYLENQKYLQLTKPLRKAARSFGAYLGECRYYRHYKCKKCRQKIRVPRGRGKIEIRCPNCQFHFVKKT